ncbi:hypothetical protein H0H92_008346, partial [Tricholoma furcatifolium]
MSTFQRIFGTVLSHAASTADFVATVRAPLDANGAHISTNAWDNLQSLTPSSMHYANSVGIDDRLLLLEDVLVLMSHLPSDSKISAKLQQEVISL